MVSYIEWETHIFHRPWCMIIVKHIEGLLGKLAKALYLTLIDREILVFYTEDLCLYFVVNDVDLEMCAFSAVDG